MVAPAHRGLRRAILLLLAGLWTLTAHMLLEATSRPVVRTMRIGLPRWPAAAPPLRVVLLSDIHVVGPSDTPARLARIVAQVDALKPDLILLAGDFMGTADLATRHYSPEATIAPLAGLQAPLGVLAVPGNHDRYFGALHRVQAALEQAGIPLLINQAVRRGPITVLALDDAATGHPAIATVLAQARPLGGVPVALTHDPAAYLRLPSDAAPLRLAGHTHCGQVAPPPIGIIVTSSDAGLRYACGPVREGDRLTLVTGGIGTSVAPIRLGAPPDFWLLTLGPAQPSS